MFPLNACTTPIVFSVIVGVYPRGCGCQAATTSKTKRGEKRPQTREAAINHMSCQEQTPCAAGKWMEGLELHANQRVPSNTRGKEALPIRASAVQAGL